MKRLIKYFQPWAIKEVEDIQKLFDEGWEPEITKMNKNGVVMILKKEDSEAPTLNKGILNG